MTDDIRCPKCGYPTLLRCAKKGSNAGRAFYVCTQYPDCRGRIPVEVNSEAIKHFNEAEHLLDIEQYDKAIIEFTKVINLDGTLETPYFYRAACHINLEQYQEAFYDYDKAIQINPHNPYSYMGRSTASKSLGENQQAIENINKAIQLMRDKTLLAKAYHNRGVLYFVIQEYNLAVQDYDKSISLDPDEPMVYFNRSSAYRALGEYDKEKRDMDFLMRRDNPLFNQINDKLLDDWGGELSKILPDLEKNNPKLYDQTRKRVSSNPNDNPTLARELIRYETRKGKKGLWIIIIAVIVISYIIAMGKVPKQPPKYEKMVACRNYRDVRDAAIKRAGL